MTAGAQEMLVVSWDGHAINDITNYQAGFKPWAEWGLPAVKASMAPRLGRWPLVVGVER